MADYTELVKRLRHYGQVTRRDVDEAAYVIEKLLGVIQRQKEMINVTAYLPLYQKPKWIPVEESLPELCVRVLACDVSGNVYESFVNVMGNWMYRKNGTRVVYWMPLPEPPKGENNG